MVEIEVTVTCNACHCTETGWCYESREVDDFLDSLTGWDFDRNLCVSCFDNSTHICTQCDTEAVLTGKEFEELGWSQFVAANLKDIIILCADCTAAYNYIRR